MRVRGYLAMFGLVFGCATAPRPIQPPIKASESSAPSVSSSEEPQSEEGGITLGELLTSCTTNSDCPEAGEIDIYKYKCVRVGGRLGKCQRDGVEAPVRLAPGDKGKFCVRKETQGEYCELCTSCDSTGKYCVVSGSPDCWYPGYVDPKFMSEHQPCPEGYVDTDTLKHKWGPDEYRTRQAYCGY